MALASNVEAVWLRPEGFATFATSAGHNGDLCNLHQDFLHCQTGSTATTMTLQAHKLICLASCFNSPYFTIPSSCVITPTSPSYCFFALQAGNLLERHRTGLICVRPSSPAWLCDEGINTVTQRLRSTPGANHITRKPRTTTTRNRTLQNSIKHHLSIVQKGTREGVM